MDGRPRWRRRVAGHLADTQMVVAEDFKAPFLLDMVMFALGAPANDGFLITPGGMGQQPTVPQLAFKALVVYEAVD